MSSIRVERYNGGKASEWNDFNKQSRYSLFMFNRNYMDYHSDRFVDHSLMFYDDEKLIAILPMTERGESLVSHGGLTYGGFIIDNNMKLVNMLECVELLKEYASECNFRKIIYKKIPYIFSNQPTGEDEYALYKCGGRLLKVEPSITIDIENPLEMATLRKRQIKKASKEGIEIIEGTEKSEYNRYIEIQNEVLTTQHGIKAVHTADELWLLHSRFPDEIRLFYALLNGQMIGGSVVYEYANAIHTQYLCSYDIGRKLGALDLTVDSIIRRYQGKKRWLDFGITSEDDGMYLNEGLTAQKEGFGGRTVTYNTWQLVF